MPESDAGSSVMPSTVAREGSDDAVLAALLLAIAPEQLKGAVLYCDSQELGDRWIEFFHSHLPAGAPFKRVPGNITDERLLGGLDMAATVARGRATGDRGLLAECDGGCIAICGATVRASTYAHVCRTLDRQQVHVERDGLSATYDASLASVVVQTADDEPVPTAMTDRVAFHVPLNWATHRVLHSEVSAAAIQEARTAIAHVRDDSRVVETLINGAERMRVTSVRAILLALATARAHAALHARTTIGVDDIKCAARLVLAPRALPAAEQQSSPADSAPAENTQPAPASVDTDRTDATEHQSERSDTEPETQPTAEELTDILVRAAAAAMPAGLITAFAAKAISARGNKGRSGTGQLRGVRGRQVGVRRGDPRGGARLDLVATLRAAVPMQRIRRESKSGNERNTRARGVELRRDDFRIRQCITPAVTTTLFVVDASGSAAMQRLAEAKGAVEMMLAEGYARRDRAALITFRGTEAQLVLPATHALARARRAITGLPAGGGTPLATALDLATTVLQKMQRGGGQQIAIVLTDGRANVARDGQGGRARAMAEALQAAERLRVVCSNVLWVDTSSSSEDGPRLLAKTAGARYLLLPARRDNALAHAVRNAHGEARSL